jgi:hypothetical protein
MTTIITALPTPPTQSDPTNFSDRADTFLTALPTFVTETNTLAAELTQIGTNSSSAATTAVAAASSAVSVAGVVKWVSGTTYANGAAVYSPSNYLTYRRITASGSGTTDPSADATNWTPVSGTGNVSTDGSGNLAIGVGGVAGARLDVRSTASNPVVKIAGTGTGLLLQANTGALGSENEEFAVDNTGRVFVNTSSTHAASDSYLFVTGDASLYGSTPSLLFNAYQNAGQYYTKSAGYSAAVDFDTTNGAFSISSTTASGSGAVTPTVKFKTDASGWMSAPVGIGVGYLAGNSTTPNDSQRLVKIVTNQDNVVGFSAQNSSTGTNSSVSTRFVAGTGAGWEMKLNAPSTTVAPGCFEIKGDTGGGIMFNNLGAVVGNNVPGNIQGVFNVVGNGSVAMRVRQFSSSYDALKVQTSSGENVGMVVNASGLVGMGEITTPSADLHIMRTAVVQKLEGSASSELRMYGTSGQVKIRNVDGSGLTISTAVTDVGTVTNVAKFETDSLTAYQPLVLKKIGETNQFSITRLTGENGNTTIRNQGVGQLELNAYGVGINGTADVNTTINGAPVILTSSAGTTFVHQVVFSQNIRITTSATAPTGPNDLTLGGTRPGGSYQGELLYVQNGESVDTYIYTNGKWRKGSSFSSSF